MSFPIFVLFLRFYFPGKNFTLVIILLILVKLLIASCWMTVNGIFDQRFTGFFTPSKISVFNTEIRVEFMVNRTFKFLGQFAVNE